MFLYMRVRDGVAARMTNIAVARLPEEEAVLDTASARGKMKIRHDAPGFEDVVLEMTNLDAIPADGVFAIRIALDGVAVIDTWVPVRSLASSASPEVASPGASELVDGPNPTVRFTPFHSPEHSAFESRTLSVYVHDEGAKKTAWDFWMSQPGTLGSVNIGDHEGAPKAKLAPGAYWLALTCGEDRSFGPIYIARQSQAGVPFNVR
jgi:hypothetical protein